MTVQRNAAEDRQAIAHVLYQYCRAMDRMDIPLGYSIWHEDGEADYGEGLFQGTGKGFVDFAAKSHTGMIAHSHQVTAIIINLKGDRAASEAYVTAVLRFEENGVFKEMTARGRYLDRWSFRDGRWAIDKRVFLNDLADIRQVEPAGFGSRSARDTSDPSYAILDL
jgi:hypothetical protein